MTNTGGVLGDIWAPEFRGTAIVCYAFAVVGGELPNLETMNSNLLCDKGPTLGPIAGGAIVSSYLRWRWTEYVRSKNFKEREFLNQVALLHLMIEFSSRTLFIWPSRS